MFIVSRRAKVEQGNRRPFYLYVDEFQNFATTSFVQMLSEARKYKLFLTMAEQTTSQQADQQMVNIILANVGSVICFRSGNPADEAALLPLFKPYLDKGEITNLSAFNFYMRIAAGTPIEPFSGRTLLLNSPQHENMRDAAVNASRRNFTDKYKPSKKGVLVTQKKKTIKSSKQYVGPVKSSFDDQAHTFV